MTRALIALTLVGGLLILGLLLVFAQRRRDQSQATRPRRAAAAIATASSTVTLKAGGNLQAAVDNAHYGDTIVLQAGATYNGPLILPYKEPKGDEYITITTSDASGIAAEGERIKPELHARAMPKVVSPNASVAVGTAERAHHYKFIGIEFSPAPNAQYVHNLMSLGESAYKSLSQFPHHLLFDRCYVHSIGLNRARRGFALNSAETSVVNSHISGFAGEGDETQAIAGWNGPGPFHIVNNYIEGGGQNIMFGGADPAVPDLVPSDIEIRRNYLYKPAEWFGRAAIKASIELKNARRVVMDGNVIESGGLTGAFVLTVRNQSGGAPWSTLEDIHVTNNIVRHTSTGVSILGRDSYHPSQQAKRLLIANNLIVDVVPDYSAVFIAACCADSVTVEHNTVQQTGNIMTCTADNITKFVFRNNVLQYNSYGIYCSDFTASWLFRGNIIADNLRAIATNGQPPNVPAGNFFVSSYDQIGFVDYVRGDWSLSQKSKYRGRGTDGRDPGVDFAALQKAVAGSDANPPYFGAKRQ